MRATLAGLGLIALLTLGGCATKDQVVQLSPTIPGERAALADSVPVALEVTDARPGPVLGRIENLSGETAQITTNRDLPYTIQLAVAEALRDYGFRARMWSEDAEPRLLVEITGIDHQVGAAVPREYSTEVSVRARAWSQGREYTAQAEASVTDTLGRPATAEANAELIDEGIGRALAKLLNEELASFLAAPQGPVTQGISE